MPGFFPTVYGQTAISPLQRNITYANEVSIFEDLSEQRFLNRLPLDTFVLNLKNICTFDRKAIDTFVANQRAGLGAEWTFDYRGATSRNIQNGNFANGLKFWTFSQDNNLYTQPFISANYQPRAGDSAAVSITGNNVSVATGGTNAGALQSSSFAVAAGQVISAHAWVAMTSNQLLPTGVMPYMTVNLLLFNSANAIVGEVAGPVLQGPASWQLVEPQFAAIPITTGLDHATLFFRWYLQNNTGGPVTIPVNCAGFCVADVRTSALGQVEVYPHCTFEDDSVTWTEEENTRGVYNGSIKFRQTLTGGQRAAGTLGAFPTFGPGQVAVTGYPFGSTDRYMTYKNDLPTGKRIAYSLISSGVGPTRALKSWNLSLPTLNNADTTALETHFMSAAATWSTFSFTDPTNAKTYNRVRYAKDTLEISHLQPDLNSVSLQLDEVFGSGWTA